MREWHIVLADFRADTLVDFPVLILCHSSNLVLIMMVVYDLVPSGRFMKAQTATNNSPWKRKSKLQIESASMKMQIHSLFLIMARPHWRRSLRRQNDCPGDKMSPSSIFCRQHVLATEIVASCTCDKAKVHYTTCVRNPHVKNLSAYINF